MKKIITFIILVFLILPIGVDAACTGTGCAGKPEPACTAPCAWTNSGGTIASPPITPVELKNPLGNNSSPEVLIGNVINAVMGVVGSLALAMFIYGGFTWMLAAGNDQRVQKGKDILLWATLGLIVIFSSYALVRLVFTGIGLT